MRKRENVHGPPWGYLFFIDSVHFDFYGYIDSIFFLVNIRVCKLSGSGAICDWCMAALGCDSISILVLWCQFTVGAAGYLCWSSHCGCMSVDDLLSSFNGLAANARQMVARQIRTKRSTNRTGIIFHKIFKEIICSQCKLVLLQKKIFIIKRWILNTDKSPKKLNK